MDIAALMLFAGVYLAAVASPGPGLAAVVGRGLGQGLFAAPAFVAGFVVGDLIWFTVAATGLAVLAKSFEALFLAIRYAGCAYLIFMAWKIWTAPVKAAEVAAAAGKARSWPSFLGSLSLTLGNPKVIVFFLSIMPLVIDPKAITPLVFAEMAVVIVLVITPVMATALVLANRARRIFTSQTSLRRINRVTATVMAGAAAVIATRG
ncbi:MAG: LysE family translocator [Hyphomicrobiales bacterium]|jgi:threonine/homoserine/homoserine lactone efflux protein|nr:LysE family translocator [Hyphomicrobiales bacterium]